MPECPSQIENLKLDQESLDEIKRIKQKSEFSPWVNALMSIAVFNGIFTKSKPPVAGYNISQAEWALYARAMSNVPAITKRAIERDIKMMILHYEMPGNYDHKHIQFWRSLLHGCQLP